VISFFPPVFFGRNLSANLFYEKEHNPNVGLLAVLVLNLSSCRKAIEDYLKDNPTAEYNFYQLRQFNIAYPASGTPGTLPVFYDTIA
jgi:hypothetical protein